MKKYYGYEIYENGDIKRNNKTIKPQLNNKGYAKIILSINGKAKKMFVHRLIATLYISKLNFKCADEEDRTQVNLDKLQINHKDGNKLNNCVDNLEWCTNLYNRRHAVKHNLTAKIPKGDKSYRAKKVKMIGNNLTKEFGSLRSALEFLGKPYNCYSSIAHCCKGDTKTAYGYSWEYIN